MTNNFELIKSLLNFETADDFYHLQILKRKKENPEIGSNSYVVKTYYIQSVSHLEKVMPEVVNLCDFNNARACINLNRRSFEKIGFHTLKKVTDQIMNRDFPSIRKAYESVCGSFPNESKRRWIIDIDVNDQEVVDKIARVINAIEPAENRQVATIPTKNGYHLITSPFNVVEFNKYVSLQGDVPDIHKDNPTILFVP